MYSSIQVDEILPEMRSLSVTTICNNLPDLAILNNFDELGLWDDNTSKSGLNLTDTNPL